MKTRIRMIHVLPVALVTAVMAALAPMQAFASAPMPAFASHWRPGWWSYNRSAPYQQLVRHVMVPMRDGTLIGCDLSLPATSSGSEAPGRFPGIFSEYTPYYTSRIRLYTPILGKYFASHGYALLTCNVRGTGDSQGTYQGCCVQPLEAQDGYDLVQWMARQPWSDGRIGMEGDSYGGMSAIAVAALHPSALKAIVPQQFDDSIYLDNVYPGGIKSTPGSQDRDNWPELVSSLSLRPDLGAKVEATWIAHPTIDSYWNNADARTKFAAVDVPDLVINSGRPDFYFRGSLDADYNGLVRSKPNAWLIVGPWQHGKWFSLQGVVNPTYELLPLGVELAWFDHWLLHLPNAPLPPASQKLVSYEEPVGVGVGWEPLRGWPPKVQESKRYLTASDGLNSEPDGSASSQTYTGQMPADSSGYSGGSPSSQSGAALVYYSSAVSHDTVLTGDIKVHLRAASSASDANLYAEVWDVAPDGTATFIDDGQLKMSHRSSSTHPTPVTPNKAYDFDFSIWPFNWRLEAGHHLALRLSGGSVDDFLPPEPTPATVTIYSGGRDPSYIELPIRRGHR